MGTLTEKLFGIFPLVIIIILEILGLEAICIYCAEFFLVFSLILNGFSGLSAGPLGVSLEKKSHLLCLKTHERR